MVFPLCVAAALPDGLGATYCPLIAPHPGLFIVLADPSPMGPWELGPSSSLSCRNWCLVSSPLLCFDKSRGGPVTSCDVPHPSLSLSVLFSAAMSQASSSPLSHCFPLQMVSSSKHSHGTQEPQRATQRPWRWAGESQEKRRCFT